MIFKDENLLKVPGVRGTFISGVEIKVLKRIPDERGTVMHMLRSDEEFFEKFGEIYFSTAYFGVIKGWHIHSKMTLNYAVVQGTIKLVLYDERENSETKGNLMEIFMGDENYILVKIPPMVWNGTKGMSTVSMIANCASLPHDTKEISRKDPFSKDIPYDWGLTHG